MGGLPFKRTVPRKSVAETTVTQAEPKEESALDLFQLRRDKTWFDEREKKAAEKAAKQDKARRERLVKEDQDVEEQLSRESSEIQTGSRKGKRPERGRRGSKRTHMNISSDDEDASMLTSPVPRKASRVDAKSPSRSRDSVPAESTPITSRSSRLKSSLPAATQVISLEDSDDDLYTCTPTKSRGRERVTVILDDDFDVPVPGLVDHDSDGEDMMQSSNDPPPPADDVGAAYIRAAQERARKRAEEVKARESRGDAIAEILVESRLEGISNLRLRIQVNKPLTLVVESWRGKVRHDSNISADVLNSMFLTWKGAKIVELLTLERMGVTPDKEGNLYSTSQSLQEGFQGWNKVHFEAWTEDLFKQYQIDRERERRRNLGEIVDEPEDDESLPQPPQERKVKIILKSKSYEDQKRSVPESCPIAKIIAAFRKTAKVPGDKIVEVVLDGEILESDTEIKDLDLEDMDVLEVHVKDAQ
ncbi:hypothetical protein TruAng_007381 [Truncatella angustata]|nr:hypothetical protein TruAng_007381 [Truncatella angustata]